MAETLVVRIVKLRMMLRGCDVEMMDFYLVW